MAAAGIVTAWGKRVLASMLCILNDSKDPYFNIALEEYLLTRFDNEYLILWRNSPCVVVGKNQNALAEINREYVSNNGIKVVRRLSGGGAVFHDSGNLNFTFIVNHCQGDFCNFRKFTAPIIKVLAQLEIKAELSKRNDLIINHKKISGNAQYKYKNRLLHHGTLLFDTNSASIMRALNVINSKFGGMRVKSVSSCVTNIRSHLNQPLTIEELKTMIVEQVKADGKECNIYELSPDDIEKVNELVLNKYGDWQWNYGVSPEYTLRNQSIWKGNPIEVFLKVKNGIIQNIHISGSSFDKRSVKLGQNLIGIRHQEKAITEALSKSGFQNYMPDINMSDFIKLVF